MRREAERLIAARVDDVHAPQPARGDVERRDLVAAGVDGVEPLAVVAQDHGALVAEPAARAGAARGEAPGGGQRAAGAAVERHDGVTGGRVRRRVDGAGRAAGRGRRGRGRDGEREHGDEPREDRAAARYRDWPGHVCLLVRGGPGAR